MVSHTHNTQRRNHALPFEVAATKKKNTKFNVYDDDVRTSYVPNFCITFMFVKLFVAFCSVLYSFFFYFVLTPL